MRLRTVLFAVCGVLALAGGAALLADWDDVEDGAFIAQEPDYNHPPPAFRPIIEPPDKSTSTCIGRPKTPLCAVETMMACLIWQRPDLCRMVRDIEIDRVPTQYLTRKYRLEYHVVEIRRAVPDDWPHGYRHVEHPELHVRPKDGENPPFYPKAVIVSVDQRACAIDAPEECAALPYDGRPILVVPEGKFYVGNSSSEGFSWFKYILVPEKSRWKIIWNDTNAALDPLDLGLGDPDKISVGAVVPLVEYEGDPS